MKCVDSSNEYLTLSLHRSLRREAGGVTASLIWTPLMYFLGLDFQSGDGKSSVDIFGSRASPIGVPEDWVTSLSIA